MFLVEVAIVQHYVEVSHDICEGVQRYGGEVCPGQLQLLLNHALTPIDTGKSYDLNVRKRREIIAWRAAGDAVVSARRRKVAAS